MELLRLLCMEPGVEPSQLQQLLMRSGFGNDTVRQDANAVAAHGHRHALRDDHRRLADEDVGQCRLDPAFRVGIECRSAIVHTRDRKR